MNFQYLILVDRKTLLIKWIKSICFIIIFQLAFVFFLKHFSPSSVKTNLFGDNCWESSLISAIFTAMQTPMSTTFVSLFHNRISLYLLSFSIPRYCCYVVYHLCLFLSISNMLKLFLVSCFQFCSHITSTRILFLYCHFFHDIIYLLFSNTCDSLTLLARTN